VFCKYVIDVPRNILKNVYKKILCFLLAPGGAASFAAGVRRQRYSVSRDDDGKNALYYCSKKETNVTFKVW
jgi:hypothetical protein